MTRWDIPSLKKVHNDTSTNRVVVRCGCGRKASTDTMIDLSVLPSNYNLPPFVCGSCWFVIQAEGVVTYREVALLHNAPEEALQRIDEHTKLRFGSAPLRSKHSNVIKKNRDKPLDILSTTSRKVRPENPT